MIEEEYNTRHRHSARGIISTERGWRRRPCVCPTMSYDGRTEPQGREIGNGGRMWEGEDGDGGGNGDGLENEKRRGAGREPGNL